MTTLFPARDGWVAPPKERDRLGETLAFAAAVLFLMVYSQGWVAPISGEEGNPAVANIIRAVYYPAYAAGLYVLFTGWREAARALWKAPLLVAMLALAAASVTWSVDPATTTRRIFAITLTTLGGVALAARFDWRRIALAMAVAFAILAVGSFFVGAFVPGIGRMTEIFPGAWRGLWFEKNALGGNMAIAFAVFGAAAALDPKRKWVWWGFAGLALILVLISTSKTSLVALLLGAGALSFVGLARRGPAAGVVLVWLAVVVIGLVASLFIFDAAWVFDTLGKDATLTGRTKIWAGIMRVVHERPTLGFGYGAVWDNEDKWAPLAKITDTAGFRARHAHSSWFEMLVNLGYVGMFVWAAYFAETWVRALVAVFTSRGAWLALPFLAVYGMSSLTESVTLTWNDLRWVMFVAVAVKLALGEKAQEASTAPERAISAWP